MLPSQSREKEQQAVEHNEAQEQERQALQRFVVSLMWLARFCGWLAYFPRPLRHFILKHYRTNETLLRVKILALIQDYGLWADLPEMSWSLEGDTKEDALRLAIRFEALAGMIDEFLEIADFSGRGEHDPLAGLYGDVQFYDCISHAPLNRRSRVFRDLIKMLLGLPC